MANNKVQLADGSVLIDLTNDTVTADTLKAGYTAHDASGNIITGTMPSGGGDETWYDAHGILYKAYMEIPSNVTIPRYVRDAYQNATHLVSYLQPYGTPSADSNYGLFRGCTALETVWVARPTLSDYSFQNCTALKNITLGRVGLAVTSVNNGVFNNGGMTHIETITVYVNASDLSGVPSAVKDRIVPSHSSGAVITYRNYESGDVIATVTVP